MCSIETITSINHETTSPLLNPVFEQLLPAIKAISETSDKTLTNLVNHHFNHFPYTASGIVVGGLFGALLDKRMPHQEPNYYTKIGILAGGTSGIALDMTILLSSILQK